MLLDKMQAAILCEGGLMSGSVLSDGTISIEIGKDDQLLGFGRAGTFEEALQRANVSLNNPGLFVEDGLSYVELTDIALRLDELVQQGLQNIFAWKHEDMLLVWLIAVQTVCVPPDVLAMVARANKPSVWDSDRRYVYETKLDPARPLGESTTTVVRNPRGEGDDGFGLRYPTLRLGCGKTILPAITEALNTEASEIRVLVSFDKSTI